MATRSKDLNKPTLEHHKLFKKVSIAVVVAEWNSPITNALMQGAVDYLKQMGVKDKHIRINRVPGSFELPLAAQFMAIQEDVDAVITLGCVIQGETRHFDFISDAVAKGIMDVGLTFNKPVVFGVLTTNTEQQAKERAGGKHGHKGIEAAETALKMLVLQNEA